MALKLNKAAVDFARNMINHHDVDSMSTNWNEHKPTTTERDNYLNTHDIKEYGLWFLATDDSKPAEAKEHYVCASGDLKMVHVSALKEAEKFAKQHHASDVEKAARELLDLIQKKMPKK